MIFDQTELALSLIAFWTSLDDVIVLLNLAIIVNFFTDLTRLVILVSSSFLRSIKILESTRINVGRGWGVKPSLGTLRILTDEVLGVFKTTFLDNGLAVLEK